MLYIIICFVEHQEGSLAYPFKGCAVMKTGIG